MADPITAEQVARAIEAARSDEGGISDALGGWQWDKRAPDYVRVAWGKPSLPDFIAALTRWHAELVAAETAKAPDDTAPERLRERREALGWTTAYAGHWVPWFDHTDVERAESGRGIPGFVSRYAAALSAAEAERMTAVGAWAKYGTWEASHLEPTSPPAPEVVDVPQPAPLPKTVAHFYTIRALPEPHRVSWNMPGDGPQWVRVNDALWLHVDDLRAMLADIDAQTGGAS